MSLGKRVGEVGDMLEGINVGFDDETNGWDIFFGGDDEYGDARDYY